MKDSGQEVFEKISRRYDLLNRVLSFGREQAWRKTGVNRLPPGRLLDLGTGTGAALPIFGDRQVVGLDPVPEMLGLNPMSLRVLGLGEQLPFRDESFEGVFSAYVFRNLTSIPETLAEIHRILVPGGTAVVVDLGRPRNPLLAMLHRAGSSIVLPLAGTTVGAREEYSYLNRSLDKLPQPEELFADGPLQLVDVWRLGPFGFAYGAELTKT